MLKRSTILLIAIASSIFTGASPRLPCNHYDRMHDINSKRSWKQLDKNVTLSSSHPYSLDEVINVALKNNHDLCIQNLQSTLPCEEARAIAFQILPEIEADIAQNYSHKKIRASTSTTQPNIQNDREAICNVLDFGLSYYQSHGRKNNPLLLQRQNLRMKQNLVLDITEAYYRTVVAKQAYDKYKKLVKNLKKQGIDNDSALNLKGLLNKDRLFTVKMQANNYEMEYRSSIAELMSLMGANTRQVIPLESLELGRLEINTKPLREFENQALRNRPELKTVGAQVTLKPDDVRTNILYMHPDIPLSLNTLNDENRNQTYNSWLTIGVRTSYELLSLPSKQKRLSKSKYMNLLDRQILLSMSMGVLAQVNLSYLNVLEAIEQYKVARESYELKAKLSEKSKGKEFESTTDSQIEIIAAEVNALKAYANAEIALEQLGNAIGSPLQFTNSEFVTRNNNNYKPFTAPPWTVIDTMKNDHSQSQEFAIFDFKDLKKTEAVVEKQHKKLKKFMQTYTKKGDDSKKKLHFTSDDSENFAYDYSNKFDYIAEVIGDENYMLTKPLEVNSNEKERDTQLTDNTSQSFFKFELPIIDEDELPELRFDYENKFKVIAYDEKDPEPQLGHQSEVNMLALAEIDNEIEREKKYDPTTIDEEHPKEKTYENKFNFVTDTISDEPKNASPQVQENSQKNKVIETTLESKPQANHIDLDTENSLPQPYNELETNENDILKLNEEAGSIIEKAQSNDEDDLEKEIPINELDDEEDDEEEILPQPIDNPDDIDGVDNLKLIEDHEEDKDLATDNKVPESKIDLSIAEKTTSSSKNDQSFYSELKGLLSKLGMRNINIEPKSTNGKRNSLLSGSSIVIQNDLTK
ncbi:MAG: TolC family protein [Chlamydiota bacterium]|nr:TolC family protein [Chlamydiota bacterium]